MKKNKEHTRKQNTIYFIIILICSTFCRRNPWICQQLLGPVMERNAHVSQRCRSVLFTIYAIYTGNSGIYAVTSILL